MYHAGYEACAAASRHTFLPAGFSEFAGYADSAKTMLKEIQHKGDALEHDEEGERFDGGAAATWATRSHRAFLTHSLAAAAAKATHRALLLEVLKLDAPTKCPSAKAIAANFRAHSAINTARRIAAQQRALHTAD